MRMRRKENMKNVKNKSDEKGGALILVLILMLVISVMAASMMFLAQSETWATANYRMMTQTRYAAETGIQAAANYLMFTYVPPDATTIGTYSYQTVSPVKLGNNPVMLSSISGESAVYADSSVISQYANQTQGTLAAGNTTLNFSSDATMLAMRQVKVFGKSQLQTVQTWLLKGRGSIAGVQNSQVEVTAIMERQVTPMFAYAAFAANSGCGALTFGGGATTNSYDSSVPLVNGAVAAFSASYGNVGTNGNLTELGTNTMINGTLSTPRAGVGTCSSGSITALTGNLNQVSGGIVPLPQPITYPTPDAPSPMPPTGALSLNNAACNYTGCANIAAGEYSLAPGSSASPSLYPDVNIKGTVHLTAGVYNFNSLTLAGAGASGGILKIDSGPVIINIAGVGFSANQAPVDLTGGSVFNPALIPSNLQILYGGTSLVKLTGGTNSSMLAYAPNATGSITGGADFYGSMITNTITDMGGAAIHYDRQLQKTLMNLGNWMLDSFTWSKF